METAQQILNRVEKENSGDITYWQQNWILSAMTQFADQQTSSLRKELEEKEREVSRLTSLLSRVKESLTSLSETELSNDNVGQIIRNATNKANNPTT